MVLTSTGTSTVLVLVPVRGYEHLGTVGSTSTRTLVLLLRGTRSTGSSTLIETLSVHCPVTYYSCIRKTE
jgi:hypothetical protein